MNIAPIDFKSRVFIIIFALTIIVSLITIGMRYLANRDYYIYAQIPCDPVTEACFAGEEDNYYKISLKKAYDFPPGDCVEGDNSCQIWHCSEEAKAHFEIVDDCFGPTQ